MKVITCLNILTFNKTNSDLTYETLVEFTLILIRGGDLIRAFNIELFKPSIIKSRI